MATLGDLRLRLRYRLGDLDPTGFFPDEALTAYLNDGARDVAEKTEAVVTTVTGTFTSSPVSLPSDFLRLVEVRSGGVLTTPADPRDLPLPAGPVKAYTYESPSSLRLHPAPDDAHPATITITYARTPAPMLSDTDPLGLPVELEDVVLAYAVWQARTQEDSPQALQAYQVYERLATEAMARSRARQPQHLSFVPEEAV